MTFFEIHNATVWRGATEALKDFSLELRAGESTAVLGPNGAGKSTFLKLLTGEVRPEANRGTQCRLFGEELWSLEELRHRIGVVMPEEVTRFVQGEIAADTVLSSLRGAYGRIFADGRKRDVLTEKVLARLYDVDLKVRWSGGWCDVRFQ
jgi:iron complex transport system ATP-binding protein